MMGYDNLRKVFTKLDITSQTALFSLFIDAVSSASNAFEDPLVSYLSPGGVPVQH